MINKLASEIDILLNKAIDINVDFKKRNYTFDELLVFLQKNNRSQDLHNLLRVINDIECSLYLLKNDLNDIADIQKKFRG
ncbi:hypothetical protein ACRPK2_09830 [Lactococcus garvieae]|uniref:hypothetical protein n=1 Tax=Lactococcus garvieae TaxID=1363 RepID=UPI003D77DE87